MIAHAATAVDEQRLAAVAALESEFSSLVSRFRRVVAENANRLSPGMLPGAYKTFTTIAQIGPLTSSALAEHLHADKGQISRTVRELEDLGLIRRLPDPNDGRSSLLEATEEGQSRLIEARRPQEGTLAGVMRNWELEDIERLTALLQALSSGEQPGSAS